MKTREELRIYIPDSKFFEPDPSALLALRAGEMQLIYSDLFAWTEDGNWPVAPILVPILAKFDSLAVEHFLQVVSKDAEWLGMLMPEFLREMSDSALNSLKPTLVRLAESPSEYEIMCGVDYAARLILNERLGFDYDLS